MVTVKRIVSIAVMVFSIGTAFAGDMGKGEGSMAGDHSMMMMTNIQWTEADDADFLAGMIVHHQGALDMVAKFANNTSDASVRQWSKDINATQKDEIAIMQEMLNGMEEKGGDAAAAMQKGMENMLAMHVSDNADINFVSIMLPHHLGAIEMSLPALAYSDNAKIRKLAHGIMISQTNEVIEFRDWLEKNQ